ncbi:DUF4254 domain-containing protein [Nocardia arthritidis]|nr:DUF4254 domain-containing protein [Nocardia arthritidis]
MANDPFPPKNQLLQACRGEASGDHPVLGWAAELADLHTRRLTTDRVTLTDREAVDEIDSRRSALVREIDRWIAARIPPAPYAAAVHTETVGPIIDRLAELTSRAFIALTSTSSWELGNVWEELAELAVGYEDLATEICAGRRRLPGGP